MEENSEPHMETDVSSTTEDIPETQEVTGSDGNVEMIIVVEKMDEEETGATDRTEERLLASPVDENDTNNKEPVEISPMIVIQVQESPTMVVEEVSKSPTTVAEGLKSPQNSPQKVVEDSKSPIKSPNKIAATLKSPINSPNKVAAVLKSPSNSPNKVAAALKSPTNSPNKVALVLKSSTNSPKTVDDVLNKPETEQTVVEISVSQSVESQFSNKIQPFTEVQQVEAADSSVLEPSPTTEDTPTTVQISPTKDVQKPVHKTPIKEKQNQDTPRPTSTKDSLFTEKASVNGKVQSNDAIKLEESNSKNITTIIPIDIIIEKESSNDSQIEMSDTSEKEHNKSISRELKSLINSAKESKIISECTQLTSKTRKSRVALDSSSLNSSLAEPSKLQDIRRNSDNSQKSNCSEKSDKIPLKRSMRSQNPEFVSKVKQFLNSVTGKCHKDSDEEDEVDEKDNKNKIELNESSTRATPPKLKKTEPVIVVEKSNKLRLDPYCWRCHWVIEQGANEKVHPPMQCTVCPRSFHFKCLSGTERNKINLEKNWVCPECLIVLQAESSETRSQAMKKISLGMLCELLKHALERMMDLNGVEPFMQPVDRAAFPDYDKYVVHPMDLSLMKTNIDDGLYGSTEAFLADAQWILHNSIIFNTLQSKLTAGARALVRSCRAEMGEVEACPECYAAAHQRRPTWFTDVCTTPHILLWAKLKGFPYWPAKAMSVNGNGLVDVRFFGAHDRAWVPAKDCFLYSEKDPNSFRTKRQDILDSMQEAEQHIRNISRKYGKFVYPPFKTQFDPTKLNEQLKMMIPSFEGEVRSVEVKDKVSSASAKQKSRSNSKSSKCSFNDGDVSESEDTPAVASRKMADGAEIAQMEEDDSILDKDVSMDVDTSLAKQKEESLPSTTTSRKRRRSEFEEAVITIIQSSGNDGSTSAKRKRVSEDKTENKQPETQEPSSSRIDDKILPTEKLLEESTDNTNDSPETPTKNKDNEPSSSTEKEKNLRVTPIRIALVTKDRRKTRNSLSKEATAKIISPSKENEKITSLRQKSLRLDKADKTPSVKTEKPDKPTSKPEKLEMTPLKSDKAQTSKPDKVEKPLTAKTDKSEKPQTPKADKADKPQTPKADKGEKPQTPKADKGEKPQTPKTDKSEKLQTPKIDKVEKPQTSKNDNVVDSKKETPRDIISRSRSEKRRNSRNNRNSLNSRSTTRSEKNAEKKSDKTAESQSSKDKTKESSMPKEKEKSKESSLSKEKEKEAEGEKSRMEKQISPRPAPESVSPRTVKDRLQFDDDTTLAVIQRETKTVIMSNNLAGLPTISCVRSLSTTAQVTGTTLTKTTTNAKTVEVTIEANSDSSIFTPTVTDNVKNMKDAVTKLQKLRNDAEPVVGRVGVRAFARMKSPNQPRKEDVQVEIKSEPIEIDDADRHMEKMDLMNAFRLRPVNPNPPSNLRDVRINKVVVTPLNARKTAVAKLPEIRPRAKKTFPQPKKPDEGRSELNSKNSMVYIPIQPPMTQAPVRLPRPHNAPPAIMPAPRSTAPLTTVSVNSLVNTISPPLMQASTMSPPSTSSASTTTSSSSTSSVASVASVPTVHTVPLMTSVNGQWMFSFQPVMSVGAIDNAPSPPIMNGVAERGNSTGPLVSLTPAGAAVSAPAQAAPVPTPQALQSPAQRRTSSENTPGEPPRLQQRPSLMNPLDSGTPIGSLPPPSTAGPVTAKLNQNAVKLTDFFRTLLEDSLEKLEEPASQLTTLRLQLEQAHWKHAQEVNEVKHNHELTLAEMRASFEKEKFRAVSEARRTAQVELETAVKLAKSKQWCANCSQEAQFYCCWNTSYCDYPCQRAHWAQHFSVCQQRSQDSNGEPPKSPENRLQPQPDLPRSTCAPTLTVGGKVASRPFAQDSPSTQKASIIVSMVEDTSGNQTMKCVGTYKPATPAQMAPIIINKQLLNNEEANKKVVASSGGYLIVGAGNNSSVVTPARRTHTIQYYT